MSSAAGPAPGTAGAITLPVHSVRDGGLVTITLNRPDHRNALTRQMVELLASELASVAGDPDLRLLVLRGAGRDFCTGLDLDEFYATATAPEEEHRAEADLLARVLTLLHRMPAPTLAAVAGRALGVGATLAVGCDVVVASSAAQLGFPEMTLGFVPAFASVLLVRSIGSKAAFELLATGRTMRADEARQLGLVSRVVPEEGWDAVVRSQVRSLCAAAYDSGLAFKQLYRQVEALPFDAAMRVAADANARARASEAFRAAAAEFQSMT